MGKESNNFMLYSGFVCKVLRYEFKKYMFLFKKTTLTLNGNSLIQTQKDPKTDEIVCVITREILSDGQLKTTIVVGKVQAVRTYTKI
jgi:hypothetical protein